MEKFVLFVVETNRGATYFIFANDEEDAKKRLQDKLTRYHQWTKLTRCSAMPLKKFLKTERAKPTEYWLSRAREYVVDETLFFLETALFFTYEDDEATADWTFLEASSYIKHNIELTAFYEFYRLDVFYDIVEKCLIAVGITDVNKIMDNFYRIR